MPQISEEYIGAFMAVKLVEVLYLARMLEVNPFDQPAVEEYKREAERLLAK